MQKAGLCADTQRTAFKQIIAEAGFRGLFVGWRIRFSMYLLHALMTVTLLDKLEVA
jgi:hypothetical protein